MPRKVAVVAYSAPPYSAGGVASAHYNLFRALKNKQVDARLFTFGDVNKPDETDITRRGTNRWLSVSAKRLNGILFGLLDPQKIAYQAVDIIASLQGSWKMGRAISRFAPDVVILSDHGAPGLMLKKPRDAKWILVSHHNPKRFIDTPVFEDYSSLDVHWAMALEDRVLQRVDAVVCPSSYMKTWFEKSYSYHGPVHKISNLLDTASMDVTANDDLHLDMAIAKNDPIIYFPSAGSRLKGADYAESIIRCTATRHSGNIGFYVPGVTELGFDLRTRGLPANAHIYLAGQVSYSENIANVKACAFGISPSLMENYSMALLEAVWCGVTMLAFDTGGNDEIIHNGKNGYLVDEGDVEGLCERAVTLLDADTLTTTKKATLKYSRKELSPSKPLEAYLELINSI